MRLPQKLADFCVDFCLICGDIYGWEGKLLLLDLLPHLVYCSYLECFHLVLVGAGSAAEATNLDPPPIFPNSISPASDAFGLVLPPARSASLPQRHILTATIATTIVIAAIVPPRTYNAIHFYSIKAHLLM